jgi:hypothetical protein
VTTNETMNAWFMPGHLRMSIAIIDSRSSPRCGQKVPGACPST